MSENPGEQVQTLKMNDGAQYASKQTKLWWWYASLWLRDSLCCCAASPSRRRPRASSTCSSASSPGGVLRKYENEIEHHRRRSTTVLLDPPSSSESGKVLSFGRARNSGVNRLLRSSTSSTSSYHSCADTSRSNSSVLENSSDDAGFTTAAAISSQNSDSNKSQHTLNSAPTSPHHKQQGNGYSHDLDKHDDTKQKPSAAAHDDTKLQQPPDFDNLLIPSSVEPYIVSEYQGHMFPEHVWTHVVLKMTAFSDDDVVTSFRFGVEGGSIGRDAGVNTASIPADKLLKHEAHARILYAHGGFYLQNCDESSSGTFVRLGPCSDLDEDDDGRMQWPLDPNVVFRVGKSDFHVTKYNEGEQTMELTVLSGKLQGTVFTIGTSGAGIGRSADNEIHASDGELSRKHAAIWFDELTHKFYLIDLNSTNGTFMKLVGPYHEPYRLEIGDDLLISQTCMTVNRFDFGVHASMGQRKTMEDAHTIIQDLNIESLSCLGLHPQSYFAVYDGHGGAEASSFLGDTLHHNIIDEFRFKKKQFDPLLKLPQDEIHAMVRQRLISAFEKTDDEFMHESERPQAGSTATTVLIAGKYLFVANTGDSRTVLSRKRVAVRLSNDHKPSRADEAQRIRDTGGFVIHGRIMGELAVSRAFGDSPFKTFELPEPPKEEANEASGNSGNGSGGKKPHSSEYDSQELPVNPNEILKGPLVIATPEVTTTEITDDDEFLLLASDGLFDVLKDQDAVDYLRQKLVELNDVQRAVEALVEHAIFQQRSTDNVTAVVILFKEPRELSK